MLELLLNILPVILGVIVLKTSIQSLGRPRRKNDKVIIALGAIAALILIVMEFAWFYVNVFSDRGTSFAAFASIWSIYHSLTMSILMLFVSPRENYKKD